MAPHYFVDEMVSGAFKSFRHQHFFKQEGDTTLVTDIFDYISPLGVLGKAADALFLKQYMQNFLLERNEVIKRYAEDEALRNVVLNL